MPLMSVSMMVVAFSYQGQEIGCQAQRRFPHFAPVALTKLDATEDGTLDEYDRHRADYLRWILSKRGHESLYIVDDSDSFGKAALLLKYLQQETRELPEFAKEFMSQPEFYWEGLCEVDSVICNAEFTEAAMVALRSRYNGGVRYYILERLCRRFPKLCVAEWGLLDFLIRSADGGFAEEIFYGALDELFLAKPRAIEQNIERLRPLKTFICDGFRIVPVEEIARIIRTYSKRHTVKSDEVVGWFREVQEKQNGTCLPDTRE